ncbi:MAG: NHLP bacteriocin system secretion protein [Cyanobacteriota bacterium]
MANSKNNLFRKEALERLSSPEGADQLIQVVSPKNWIALFTTGSLLTIALVWSVFGRIPITLKGKGVLIEPRKVVNFESPIAAQLKELKVEPRQCVEKGQVLATIDPSQINQQLQQQRTKLTALKTQNQELSSVERQQRNQEKQFIQQQRQAIEQRLQGAREIAPEFNNREIEAIAKQRQVIQQKLQNARELAPVLQQRLENRRQLKAAGAISSDALLTAEQTYLEAQTQITELQAQLQELNIREVKAKQAYQDSQSQIAELQAELQELDSKEKAIAQQNLEAANTRSNPIQEVQQTIAQLELKLQENSQIVSQHSGCILELTVATGEFVSPGTRLGSIQLDTSSSQMIAVTYFPVEDGKKIQPGMEVQITPNTVKREQFGGILGRVTNVSAFPVTKQGAERVVGNAEVVESVMPKGGAIAVFAELKRDASALSGYRWSTSEGPQLQLTPGTTTSALVTVKKQAPIEFVFPLWKGVKSVGSIKVNS